MISAGRLRFTATIKRETSTDVLGKKQKDFSTTVGTFRCDLRDLGSNEVDYGEGVSVINTYEVLARWQAILEEGLLETDRLVIDGKTFNISGIRNEHNRDRLATITVEEIL